MSQPEATIVYEKIDKNSVPENLLVLFNSSVKDILEVSLSSDRRNNFDDISKSRIDTPIFQLINNKTNENQMQEFICSNNSL